MRPCSMQGHRASEMRARVLLLIAVCSTSAARHAAAAPPPASDAPADAVAKARTLRAWGDGAGALRLLAQRVEADPSDVDARTLYGTMLADERRYDEARAQLERVLEARPADGAALGALARIELGSNNAPRAIQLLSAGLDREPTRADLLVARARALLVSGNLEAARADLDAVLARDPGNAEARELRRRVGSAAGVAAELDRAPSDDSAGARIAAALAAVPRVIALAALEKAEPAEGAPAPRADVVAEARALAQRGERARALELLRLHIEATPTDTDARTLYGNILAWEGRYGEARRELGDVLGGAPKHGDAIRAAINVELWSGRPERAEELATEGLASDPNATDLLMARARARFDRGEFVEALADVDRVLAREPDNTDALLLRRRIEAARRVWTVSGIYTLDAFSDGRSPWHEGIVQLKRATPIGAAILRHYVATRWDSADSQVEVEVFPKFREGTYADLGAAFALFRENYPVYRVQADIYQSLPLAFEVSAGYRHMQFDSGVDMFVLSAGKYLGDWFLVVRSFITPGLAGTSISASGSVRRYFGDADTYVGLRYGHGLSKEEVRSLNDIALLSSNNVGFEGSMVFLERIEAGLRGAIAQEMRANQSDLWQYTLTASAGVRF